MEQKQEILSILFKENMFADSENSLVALLEYAKGSRRTVRRIKEGASNIKEKTIEDIFIKLQRTFQISEQDIIAISNCVTYSHSIFNELKATYKNVDDWHNTAFKALVKENYSVISTDFNNKFSELLYELKLENPDVYYGTIAYCYILCKGITPNTADGKKNMPEQLREMNDFLYSIFPANSVGRTGAEKCISYDLADGDITLIKLIYNVRVIFEIYIDEKFMEKYHRNTGILFDVSEDSFWVEPGEGLHQGCVLWYFHVIPTYSVQHGSYIAIKLRDASNLPELFKMEESYHLIFTINKDQEATPILLAFELSTGKIEYDYYNYEKETKTLQIGFGDEYTNAFGLPSRLQCIKDDNFTNRKWTNFFKKITDEHIRTILLKACNSSCDNEYIYLDEYNVTDVMIGRKRITLTLHDGNVEKNYSLPINAYPFFERLTPKDYVSVVRSKKTNELLFTWNILGQFIPLKEWE